MSASIPVPAKERSRLLLLNIKKRLAWNLCADLLNPPLAAIGALKFDNDDSEEIKRSKTKEYEEKKAQLKREEAAREPELLAKLDEIVDRVVYSRSEKPADNEEVWASGGALGGDKMSALAGLVCDLCGNKNSAYFTEDLSSGDTICLGKDGQWSCGKVVQDHKVFEGVEKRNFEDDDKDRHQHGAEADPLMPDSENMRTFMATTNTDALSKAQSKELQRTHQRVEDNLSSIGNDERKTRTGTRTKQKRIAFDLMSTVCSSLGIHRAVLNKAHAEFARYRDVREHVHNFNAVVAACMLLSYEAILKEGGLVDAASEEETKTKTFFGDDRLPFAGGGAGSSLLAAEDVAISGVKEKPMGRWGNQELRQWLTGVLEAREKDMLKEGNMSSEVIQELHMTLVDRVIDHVDAQTATARHEQARGDKKRKFMDATPSFFGSTTMSHRNKKFYVGSGGGSGGVNSHRPVVGAGARTKLTAKSTGGGESAVTCGQVFLRLNLEAVLGGSALLSGSSGSSGLRAVTPQQINDVIADIRSAMKTRALYDAAVKEKAVVEEKEARRHAAENSSRFLVLNQSAGSSTHQSKSEDDEADDIEDDMLQEMLNSAQYQNEGNGSKGDGNIDSNSNDVADSDHSANDEDEYNVYDALRKEERNRNSMMRFKIQK